MGLLNRRMEVLLEEAYTVAKQASRRKELMSFIEEAYGHFERLAETVRSEEQNRS
jgi:hypothetical protein